MTLMTSTLLDIQQTPGKLMKVTHLKVTQTKHQMVNETGQGPKSVGRALSMNDQSRTARTDLGKPPHLWM